MIKKAAYFLVPLVLVTLVYLLSNPNDEAYVQQVLQKRSERIRYLKTSKDSPFAQFNQPFDSLAFFEIDPKYKVRANLERIASPRRMSLPNSDGTDASYTTFAYAHFRLEGQEMKLLILKPAGMGPIQQYFTGFADATSGISTYGGGRYLDVEIGKSDNIELDFNLAYNPYCAYVSGYTCPLPPKENLLPVSIAAGEKDYPGH